jgi:exosortase C (VPDSG-CTERM-specific)
VGNTQEPFEVALQIEIMSEHDQVNHEVSLDCRSMGNRRLWGALAALGIVCLAFIPVFQVWFRIAMGSDLHSHVILIPLVCAYLLMTDRKDIARDSKLSRIAGMGVISLSGVILGWTLVSNPPWSIVDLTALRILTFVGFVWGIGFLFAGSRWMRSAIFPMGFLLFMIPLPDLAVQQLEELLMVMSARLAETIFSIGSVPVFRNGQVLELPGVVLKVAQECSGIRSTWVLFITSVLAAYLFLPTIPRRIALVAAVLPLGVLRNAVRIYVIGWLCVHVGPEMIDSWIHRKGGPVFFAVSLVPLFLMAWWLRRRKPADSTMGKGTTCKAD